MALPPITYGSLTQYFHNVALGHSSPGVTAGDIASALTGLLGRSSAGSFNFGTSPVQQSISASLGAARQSLSNASATAKRFDDVNAALTQVGQIAGTLAPSSTGSPFGDATTLPAAGSTSLPDTLQGNINRAQRAGGLSGAQQSQEQIAAQTRFNALRSQAEQLVDGLQRVQLSDPARQRAFDNAIADLRGALDDSANDPNRVRTLSFASATTGGATSPGTFDASIQGNATGTGAPIGRASARAAVGALGTAITAARNALAPDRAVAHQQVTSAQGVVTQLTQFQTQASTNSLSLGGGATGGGYNPVSLFQSPLSLYQSSRNSLFPRGGLMNLYA